MSNFPRRCWLLQANSIGNVFNLYLCRRDKRSRCATINRLPATASLHWKRGTALKAIALILKNERTTDTRDSTSSLSLVQVKQLGSERWLSQTAKRLICKMLVTFTGTMLNALHKPFGKWLLFAKAAFEHNDRLAQTRQKGSFMF